MTEGDVELATLSKFNSSSHPITVPHQLESAIKSGAPPPPPPTPDKPSHEKMSTSYPVAKPNTEFV